MQMIFGDNLCMPPRDEKRALQQAAVRLMRAAVEASGLTAAALARRAGVAPSTISRPLNDPGFSFTPRPATLAKIAAAAGLDMPEELRAAGFADFRADQAGMVSGGLRQVPVVGEVRAGMWAEVAGDVAPDTWIPVSIPEYERAALFALRVVGRSMDKFYPDGSVVVVAPAHEAGVRLGDHVVVRRHRGNLVETTLKEVVQDRDGAIALFPRSTDPAFQEPFRIDRVRDADEGPEIIGVVVASYNLVRGRAGPLIDFG